MNKNAEIYWEAINSVRVPTPPPPPRTHPRNYLLITKGDSGGTTLTLSSELPSPTMELTNTMYLPMRYSVKNHHLVFLPKMHNFTFVF